MSKPLTLDRVEDALEAGFEAMDEHVDGKAIVAILLHVAGQRGRTFVRCSSGDGVAKALMRDWLDLKEDDELSKDAGSAARRGV